MAFVAPDCCTANGGYNRDHVDVDSTFVGYSDPVQTLLFLDPRTVGRLLSDVPDGTPIDAGDIPTNPTFEAFNMACSGIVEAAALRGEKYTVAQLLLISQPYTNPDDPMDPNNGKYRAGARLMSHIHSDYIMVMLNERRGRTDTPEYRMRYERQNGWIELLERGRRIFGTIQHEQAGRKNFRQLTAEEIACQEVLVQIARPFFGQRSNLIYASGPCGSGTACCSGDLEDNPNP